MTFDTRNNIPRVGRIIIARGCDSADVSPIVFFGPHILKSLRISTCDLIEASPEPLR